MKIFITATLALILSITDGYGYAQHEDMSVVGQGKVYYLGLIKVYDAYLYSDSANVLEDILEPTVSKCLKLNYEVSLTPENFIEGANKVLGRQHSEDDLNILNREIEALHDSYLGVEKGDTYELCYNAESETTTLALNGKQLVAIASPKFSSLYFGIWLSDDNPIDSKLQRSLVSPKL